VTSTNGATPHPARRYLEHLALFYNAPDEYAAGCVQFVHEGLAAGSPVFVVVPGIRVELLRERLGWLATQVEFADMTVTGRNPARIIPTIRQFTDKHPDHRVHVIGEPIWAGRTPAEICEATRHEALLNVAFAKTPISLLCLYDSSGLDHEVLADAGRTHPVVAHGADRWGSPSYADPSLVYRAADQPLPAPPAGTPAFPFDQDDIPAMLQFVWNHASASGLRPDQIRDLLHAVSEIASNTAVHTTSGGMLRIWTDPKLDSLICELHDSGRIHDVLVGRRHPLSSDAVRGRGLWLVNQCCDLVELRSDEGGTVIRLHTRLGPT
jgi:anti-sigma regulatory factor (Ser/Thr protein kinase)